ncbi:MAG: peptidylprolyl isomerase [Phycisphaerales bacterium]
MVRRKSGRRSASHAVLEPLEPRLALYNSPFLANLPTLADMENPDNTVVRFQLSQGLVDIELYDQAGPGTASAAPITTANFLNYVRSGRLDDTFFHRLAEAFVLQGGGFSFNRNATAPPRSMNVMTDPPILNEFDVGRSNIERTVSMAKVGGNANSATSQFFFNLDDNSGNLNGQNGGFTVFGRVIKGWDVITTIAAFRVDNLDTFMNTSGNGAFTEVPLSGANNTDLVYLIDAEVIKPAEVRSFIGQSAYFPDGYRSGKIVSSIELFNEDPNSDTAYQVIARYEGGLRDKVIDFGTLVAGGHLSVQVSKGGDPTVDKVRADTPFAYEVRSTRPLSASINHRDFGATAGEAFFRPAQIPAAQLQSWDFAAGQKGSGLASFLVYQNLTGQNVSITATFYSETGSSFAISKTLEAYRRGGLNINSLTNVPDGLYSVRVVSNQPIVAALSQYRAFPARASTELGQFGGGSFQGILPGAIITASGQATISVLFTGDTPATVTVDFEFILSDGSVLTNNDPFTLTPSQRRRDLDLTIANVGIPTDEFFTIRYSVRSNAARVSAAYISIAEGDTIASTFQDTSTQEVFFADGFTDPTPGSSNQEVISLWNPYSDSTVVFSYRLRFHFVNGPDGEIILPTGGTGTIPNRQRIDIPVSTLTDVMARISSDPKFRHYSITVTATAQRGAVQEQTAIFAQLTRIDSAGSIFTTNPSLSGEIPPFPITDPRFTP